MEVFLNSIWLLVAIGAFLFWQVDGEKGTIRRREHSSRYRILALAVALVLLFPVISLTDDLHSEQAAMEDSSRSVMKARSLAQGCLRASRAPFVAAVVKAPYAAAVLHLFQGAVVLAETPLRCHTPVSAHEGRSPPFNA
jgi:hypothetical protein